MAAILTSHKLTIPASGSVPAKIYFFLANPKTYQGIGSNTGVDQASNTEQDERKYSVAEMLAQPDVTRLVIYYKKNGKPNAAHILCATSKVPAFTNGYITYQGDTKAKARMPRRATFY